MRRQIPERKRKCVQTELGDKNAKKGNSPTIGKNRRSEATEEFKAVYTKI